jgi:hypothetical protein
MLFNSTDSVLTGSREEMSGAMQMGKLFDLSKKIFEGMRYSSSACLLASFG